jgi:hypothetical protein
LEKKTNSFCFKFLIFSNFLISNFGTIPEDVGTLRGAPMTRLRAIFVQEHAD